MTEAEWLTSTNLQAMLDFISDKVSHRKLRLFACACVRQVWTLLADERSRKTVLTAEKFADGLATKADITAAALEAKLAAEAQAALPAVRNPRQSVANLAAAKAAHEARTAIINAHWAASWTAVGAGKVAAWAAAKNSTRQGQTALLREIVGNPFETLALPEQWPAVVTMMAQGVYEGERGQAALYAMLANSGPPEVAEHFRDPSVIHPKGCWALDLLMGKT